MLRSLALGVRDFKERPDTLCVRHNWIILCLFEGSLHPHFEPPLAGAEEPHRYNFWVIPPQTKYVLIADSRRCDRAVFHFSEVPEILRTETRARGYLAQALSPRQLSNIKKLATSIKADFEHPTAVSELRYEEVLIKLSLIALEHLATRPVHIDYNVARERVEKALRWYDENIRQAPSLQDVARNVHVSGTHLRRHFYERLGRSPKSVFSKLRMQKATKLLMSSALTLEQLAAECGFETASDFCRAFKRHFGVAPGAWRQTVNSSQLGQSKSRNAPKLKSSGRAFVISSDPQRSRVG